MVKALDEIGLPLDLIGGCSMGSIIAAQRALGWPWQEILDRNREMWLRSGSLFDYTIPMVSLIAGRKAERMAAKIFGDVFVQDLWTNFFCVMCIFIRPSKITRSLTSTRWTSWWIAATWRCIAIWMVGAER